jgi:MFS family permease
VSRAQWSVLILLIVSIFLNYIDRSNLAVAAPLIEKEMDLSPTRMGVLFSAFFWTYALLQLFGAAGWAADRFPVGWVLGAGTLLWSGATVAAGMVSSFGALFATRLVLGAGESLAYPCYSKVITQDLPLENRGFANSLLDAGSKLGPSLGTLAGGLLLAHIGWRPFFIGLGFLSLLWLLPWLRWMPGGERQKAQAQERGPSTLEILLCKRAWGAFGAHFCGNYYWFFLTTWLPTYLIKERHFSMAAMAQISSIAFLLIAAATVMAGWLSDRWVAAGVSPTRARKSIVVGGLCLSTIILPVAVVADRSLSVALLLLACTAFGTYTSNHWAITQTLAGPLAAGRWTSLQNGIGNLSGIAAAWLTGWVVETTGAFPPAFLAAAVFALLGAALWGLATGPVTEVPWRAQPTPHSR